MIRFLLLPSSAAKWGCEFLAVGEVRKELAELVKWERKSVLLHSGVSRANVLSYAAEGARLPICFVLVLVHFSSRRWSIECWQATALASISGKDSEEAAGD